MTKTAPNCAVQSHVQRERPTRFPNEMSDVTRLALQSQIVPQGFAMHARRLEVARAEYDQFRPHIFDDHAAILLYDLFGNDRDTAFVAGEQPDDMERVQLAMSGKALFGQIGLREKWKQNARKHISLVNRVCLEGGTLSDGRETAGIYPALSQRLFRALYYDPALQERHEELATLRVPEAMIDIVDLVRDALQVRPLPHINPNAPMKPTSGMWRQLFKGTDLFSGELAPELRREVQLQAPAIDGALLNIRAKKGTVSPQAIAIALMNAVARLRRTEASGRKRPDENAVQKLLRDKKTQ